MRVLKFQKYARLGLVSGSEPVFLLLSQARRRAPWPPVACLGCLFAREPVELTW
jgi:hypothetical protein